MDVSPIFHFLFLFTFTFLYVLKNLRSTAKVLQVYFKSTRIISFCLKWEWSSWKLDSMSWFVVIYLCIIILNASYNILSILGKEIAASRGCLICATVRMRYLELLLWQGCRNGFQWTGAKAYFCHPSVKPILHFSIYLLFLKQVLGNYGPKGLNYQLEWILHQIWWVHLAIS